MASFWKIGAMAWCLTVIGWFLSPIISLLVNKLFVYLVFDASTKLKELEIHTIPRLKQTLDDVVEQTVLRAAQEKGSQCDLKILDSMKKDLKSALYEAEDILDLIDCHRIEKDLHLGDDASSWVESQLGAACAWIARCKGSWFGRRIDAIRAGVMKGAQSMIRLCQFVIQGWRHSRQNFDLFCICRAINIAGATVLQCAQSCYQQLGQLFRCVILRKSGALLPVSGPAQQPPCLESRGSEFVPANPTRRPAEEMVDEEEIVEETQVEEGEAEVIQDGEEGAMLEEIEEESCEGEVGETSEEGKEGEPTYLSILQYCARSMLTWFEEIEEESCEGEVGETSEEGKEGEPTYLSILRYCARSMLTWFEEIEEESCEGEVGETSEEGKEGEPTSLSILRYCARSMLTWFAKACFYRDWSYGIVGIKNDKKDGSAAELVHITERISLRNRIKRIEDVLTASKKSDVLNDKNSSSGTTQDADKESSSFNVKQSAKEGSRKQKEIDKLYINIDKMVFGREKDRAHVCRMLREGPYTYAASSSRSKPYSVVGIYGIAGSGKSTLAQYVCDYEKGVGHFNPIMFIYVAKTFSVVDIFCEMLEQIKQQQASDTKDPRSLKEELKDIESLKAELMEKLKHKCFLLVLDDLWVNDENQKEQDILLDTLSAAVSGSRVLVTSQKTEAAQDLGAQEQFSIPDLEEKVYLSLFMHHALPDASDDDEEYKRIGSKIANRLRRSPIAAVTVGKQLKRNKSIRFWETTANLDVLNKTMGALWWSYQQLGVDIRRCFAYCSTFPKGYVLQRDGLVSIWIAQGFVNTRSNATEELEDVGQRYFDELLTFSFLQVERTFFGNQIFIHDLLHELTERVAGSDFFRIVSNDWPKNIPTEVHHLFVSIGTDKRQEIPEKIHGLVNLRTLIIKEHYTDMAKMPIIDDLDKVFERLFKSLTKLRVLIIETEHKVQPETMEIMKGIHDNLPIVFQNMSTMLSNFLLAITKGKSAIKVLSVPACIDQMKHLRCLCFHFRGGFFNLILPSTFSKLYHIQIIDIPCLGEVSCPEDMANLICLRHISAYMLLFPNIGRLTSLQTLEEFRVKDEQGYGLEQLKHLNKLRGTLRISGLEIVASKEEALEAHLTHKERLRKLSLSFGWPNGDPDVEAEVLEGLCPPKDLEELDIHDYTGSRYPSWMLSRHHSETTPKHLHKLELYRCSQLASIPKDSELFVGLHELRIENCDWDRLPENMERLVSLQTLTIWKCDKIELLPTLPQQRLKNVTIKWCRALSETCKEEGHENWCKIQHIPEKYIE